MTALSDELKPCPFCGGSASLHPRTCDKNTPYNPADRAFPIARCGQCGAEAPGKDWGRPETAAEKWNARALLAEQARTEPTKLESNIHESSETYLYADVEAACWGEYTVEASRDNKGADWYIVVTAPNGMRDYDGYWRNSAHKTVDDVINEAICGACLTAVPQPQPLKAEQAKDAAEDAELLDWLEEKHYALHPIKEAAGDDQYTLWWQVTDKRKSISGHPLGNIRAAIRAARAAERKAP